jgi:hypothetical protein
VHRAGLPPCLDLRGLSASVVNLKSVFC